MAKLTDIALNKPATQSSVSEWSEGRTAEDDAARANNGIHAEEYAFHTSAQYDPWWQVDLQGVFGINEVRLLNRKHCIERLRRFSVLLSLDGLQWVVVYQKEDDSLVGLDSDSPLPIRFDPERHLARYVRIRLDGVDALHLRSCQIFGTPVDAAIATEPTARSEEATLNQQSAQQDLQSGVAEPAAAVHAVATEEPEASFPEPVLRTQEDPFQGAAVEAGPRQDLAKVPVARAPTANPNSGTLWGQFLGWLGVKQ